MIARRPLIVPVLAALVVALCAGRAAAGGGPADARPRFLVAALTEPERIVTVELRTGAVRELALPGGTLCRAPLLLVRNRIVYLRPGRPHGVVMSVDLALRRPPRFVGRADEMTASPEIGRIWLGVRTERGRLRLREHFLASGFGRRARHTLPPAPLLGAVPGAILLGGESSVGLWDPDAGARLRAVPGPFLLAAHGTRVASCGGRCTTVLLSGGARGRVVHAPDGSSFRPAGAAFSPDGTRFAVPLAEGDGIALVDTASGLVRAVAGLPLGPYAAMAWAGSGPALYAVGPDGRTRSYGPGDRRPASVGVRFPGPVMQLLVVG